MSTEDQSTRRNNQTYILSIDNAAPKVWVYCLTRVTSQGVITSVEVILAKSEYEENKIEFYIEVVNLAKYFNAKLIYDKKNAELTNYLEPVKL